MPALAYLDCDEHLVSFFWLSKHHVPICNTFCFDISTNRLGFTPEFLGRVKLVTSAASLIGVGVYNGFLKKVPLRKIFFVTTVIGVALGMTQVWLTTLFASFLKGHLCISSGFSGVSIFLCRFSWLLG